METVKEHVERPFVLVQLSDLHIGATWAGVDPLARFRGSLQALLRLPSPPDAVIVSGDLADHGAPEEYAVVKEGLAQLGVPVHVVPGNHDDRRTLRRCFQLPGEDGEPVDYTADSGPLRLVMLDSTVPGEVRGDLGTEQLKWLERTLRTAPGRPTILVMHHPPLHTGVAAWDKNGLSDRARVELERVVCQQTQLRGILAGHLHRTIAAIVGGHLALTVPSTFVQGRLDLTAEEFGLAEEEPPGFAVHTLLGCRLISHVEVVTESRSSRPRE